MNEKATDTTNDTPQDGPLRDVLAKLEEVMTEAGDRLSKILEDAEIRRRLSDALDALDDVRLEVTRRLTGTPATPPLENTNTTPTFEDMTVKELRQLASEREIKGRSSMNKAELVDALRQSS